MHEYNLLDGYPQPSKPRYVSDCFRTIEHRLVAAYRDERYYDGDRSCGYGGFSYDGRWRPAAEKICSQYLPPDGGSVLQIGCEKGFLLHDLLEVRPNMKVRGTEISEYAVAHAMPSVKPLISLSPFTELPFCTGEFDYVLAIGVIYTLNLPDAIKCLREIQRVGIGKSFITLASYRTADDYWLFRAWTLLGATILRPDEWVEVLQHVGYTGDYTFTGAWTLNLKWVQENGT